jgi:hypothetical protein
LLALLIAHGTNLGIAAMGQSAQGITVDMLQHVNRWFLREETLKAANAVLVNYHYQLPLSAVWGGGIAISRDISAQPRFPNPRSDASRNGIC